MNEAFDAARRNKHIEAKVRHECETLIMWAAKGCLNGWKAKGPVILHYTFYEQSRRRDKDNISGYAHKLVQDALVKGHYLKNDGWNDIEGYTDEFRVDAKRPRVEVVIEEVE